MGGGAGLSMHGRFRVVTENAVFAMPEASLGLYPDVGASYFLSRLPGCFGEYLGLTGARINGAEMLACCLATHFVPSMWQPSKLELVTDEMVDQFFAKIEDDDWAELQLRGKSSPAYFGLAKL
ncbi:hypothetical protein Syun_018321 [Stephania yunnanensis]|uniref:3-hydroxyisobutyryl-CoA hydrolase n=1 Tax=Stephania yunnanensis TaxID=152371 RepID=A0AAP0IS33_9MAGN